MKKSDLEFKNKFEITFTKQDYCHALVFFFDVVFSTDRDVAIVLGTGTVSSTL